MKKEQWNHPDIGKGKIFSGRDLWKLMLPLVVEQFLTLFVGMIDSVMVSSVGESAVSGVSLVDTVMQLLIYIFAALGTGGAVVAGQYLGSGNKKKACESAEQLIWFSALVSLVVIAGTFLLKGAILHRFFGDITPQVRAYADTYLTITAFSIPAIAVYEAGAATFRTMGNSKVTMWISLMMNLINISGNAVFIYGFHMRTGGAAISTLLSRAAAAAVITVLLLDSRRDLFVRKTLKISLNWDIIKRVLYVGVPNGLENGMFQLGKILVLNLVSVFGTQAIAANAIALNVASIQVIPGLAISLGLTTVISRCVGKEDYQQARYYNRRLLLATYGALLIIDFAMFFAMPLILKMYQVTEVTAHLTVQMVLCHTLGAVVFWPMAFDLPALMRAAGDVKFAMIVSILSMWVCRIGSSYLMAYGFHMGAVSVWIAMVLDWIFRTAVFGGRWLSGKWTGRKVI